MGHLLRGVDQAEQSAAVILGVLVLGQGSQQLVSQRVEHESAEAIIANRSHPLATSDALLRWPPPVPPPSASFTLSENDLSKPKWYDPKIVAHLFAMIFP